MKIVSTICGPFDMARRDTLKKAYDKAVEAKQETFEFESQPMLVAFTKYLLEYLETALGGSEHG